ncbi:MAG: hypothetical protein ACYTG0_29320 [Planctomycetota bacterium]|jgi:hypothetical protein
MDPAIIVVCLAGLIVAVLLYPLSRRFGLLGVVGAVCLLLGFFSIMMGLVDAKGKDVQAFVSATEGGLHTLFFGVLFFALGRTGGRGSAKEHSAT